jgi:hypothetical protein
MGFILYRIHLEMRDSYGFGPKHSLLLFYPQDLMHYTFYLNYYFMRRSLFEVDLLDGCYQQQRASFD